MKKILLALGGNALGNNPEEQEKIAKETSRYIVKLVEDGYQVVITHGNGPQVGMINLAMESENIPLAECIAMSQGYIGYHLEKGIREELLNKNIKKEVAIIPTQVLVKEDDIGFKNPTKPIGRFYTEEEKEKIILERNDFIIKEDSNRGYRRFVASPKPIEIIELDIINNLIEKGNIVIAGGGGGVPVIKKGNRYIGVDGVVDKDFTSSLLARELDMDMFIILTQVDRVCINFGKDNEKEIGKTNIEELEKYILAKEFGEGSMLPKIEASIDFLKNNNKKAIITSIFNISKALEEDGGTHICF